MANKYLAREEAPIGPETWKVLDGTMVEAAKSVLAGRRLLHIEGPYGLGLKAVPLQDSEVEGGLISSPIIPVSLIELPFTLGKRDVAAYECDGVSLDSSPLSKIGATLFATACELLTFSLLYFKETAAKTWLED